MENGLVRPATGQHPPPGCCLLSCRVAPAGTMARPRGLCTVPTTTDTTLASGPDRSKWPFRGQNHAFITSERLSPNVWGKAGAVPLCYRSHYPCAGWLGHPLAQRRHAPPQRGHLITACTGPVSRGSVHGSAPSCQPRMSSPTSTGSSAGEPSAHNAWH